jgi:hypothetical protein
MFELQCCDVLVEPCHGFYGFGAKLFGEDYQHARMVGVDVSTAWESVSNGVHCNPILPSIPYAVFRLNLTEQQKVAIVAAAKADEGKPYGYLQLFLDGLSKVFNRDVDIPGVALPGVCSVEVLAWFRAAGIDLCPGLKLDDCKPSDLVRSPILVKVGTIGPKI